MAYKDDAVQLGFVEELPEEEQYLVLPEYLPSKVGGLPSWVGGSLLSSEQTTCPVCNQVMPLLLQIYAPLSQVNDQAYHRMIFVLCCKNGSCHGDKAPFKVFRVQIPETNSFIVDFDENECDPSPDQFRFLESICDICGWKAKKHCSKCKTARYCDRDHQILDWKSGHKEKCAEILVSGNQLETLPKVPEKPETPITNKRIHCNNFKKKHSLLFNEYEIVTEEEEKSISEKVERIQPKLDNAQDLSGTVDFDETNDDEDTIKERVKTQLEILDEYKKRMGDDAMDNDEEEGAENYDIDANFVLFQEITEKSPEQILRYSFGNQPLWVHSTNKPEDIPPCQCGAPRVFEFQILPQLLYYLKVEGTVVNSIDWGTLIVYTCSKSCSTLSSNDCIEEFLWRQQLPKLF